MNRSVEEWEELLDHAEEANHLLRQQVRELERELRLSTIDAANEMARANDAEKRVEELEREVVRKDHGYTAIIKMERDARDQFRERAEAAEAKAEQCRTERDRASREAERAGQELVIVLGKIAATTTPHAAKLRDMARKWLAAAKGKGE